MPTARTGFKNVPNAEMWCRRNRQSHITLHLSWSSAREPEPAIITPKDTTNETAPKAHQRNHQRESKGTILVAACMARTQAGGSAPVVIFIFCLVVPSTRSPFFPHLVAPSDTGQTPPVSGQRDTHTLATIARRVQWKNMGFLLVLFPLQNGPALTMCVIAQAPAGGCRPVPSRAFSSSALLLS